MADIRLVKPESGTTQSIPAEDGARFVFDFPTDEAAFAKNEDNLSISFADGSRINVENFYTQYNSENMPEFEIDGQPVGVQEFFSAMNEPDLVPAAGPSAAMNGGRYRDYTNLDLASGIDHLTRLDYSSSRSFEWDDSNWITSPDTDGYPEGAEIPVNNPVTITPAIPWYPDPNIPEAPGPNPWNPDGPGHGMNAPHSVVRVHERNIDTPDGTQQESFIINAPDGVSTISIGNRVVYGNGRLVAEANRTFHTDEGKLLITGFDPATGRLTYTYELTDPTDEHRQPGEDSISHTFKVSVTDTDGDHASSYISVIVVDDIPEATPDSAIVTEGQRVFGNVVAGSMGYENQANVKPTLDPGSDDHGADGQGHFDQAGNVLVRWNVDGVHNADGSITVTKEGEYTVTLNPDGSYTVDTYVHQEKPLEFKYSIIDHDGDVADSTLTIVINPTKPIVVEGPPPDPKDPDPDDPPKTDDHNPDPEPPTDSSDPSTPRVTVGHIVMDEGDQPELKHDVGAGHPQEFGYGTFIANMNGENGWILVGDTANGKGYAIHAIDGVAYFNEPHNAILTDIGIQVEITGARYDAEAQNWVITYKYTLTGHQEHGEDNTLTNAVLTGSDIPVTVVDESGDQAYGKLTVELHDDVPIVEVVKNEQDTVNVSMGADIETENDIKNNIDIDNETVEVFFSFGDQKDVLQKWQLLNPEDESSNTLVQDVNKLVGEYINEDGTVIMMAHGNGKYSFRLVHDGESNIPVSKTNIDIKVVATDTDKDTDEAVVKLTVPTITPGKDPDPDSGDSDDPTPAVGVGRIVVDEGDRPQLDHTREINFSLTHG